ncbi:MAG: hypothetical protein DRJ51_00565 [Thermoprotei archaeon]|mgnify:CR=1 FL=1|nr:MAG: hypothetical protein DRJ51_00565 [Thermoprotei archaeon]RLF01656.1 MAG: hypothetical protein DRJ59_05580 [Thermoprotei archaeon]
MAVVIIALLVFVMEWGAGNPPFYRLKLRIEGDMPVSLFIISVDGKVFANYHTHYSEIETLLPAGRYIVVAFFRSSLSYDKVYVALYSDKSIRIRARFSPRVCRVYFRLAYNATGLLNLIEPICIQIYTLKETRILTLTQSEQVKYLTIPLPAIAVIEGREYKLIEATDVVFHEKGLRESLMVVNIRVKVQTLEEKLMPIIRAVSLSLLLALLAYFVTKYWLLKK